MALPTNRDKDKEVDEGILDEPVPDINEPQPKDTDDDPENQEPTPEPQPTPTPVDDTPQPEPEPEAEPDSVEPEPTSEPEPTPTPEPVEDQEKRYKSQQTEAQIQAARNKVLIDKIDQSNTIADPTEDEMVVFVNGRGGDWELLSPFEQETQRDIWKGKRRDQLLNEAVKTTKDIDTQAQLVDDFLDTVDTNPKYVALQGHEAEFRAFAMKESHRGVPIDSLLLPAFLQSLPAKPARRADLFPKGGGGEREDSKPGKITDTDQVTNLRKSDPRAFKRALKEGKVDIDV